MKNTYVVIPEKDVTDTIITDSLNKEDTYRKSLDGTQAVIKFNHLHPNCCKGIIKYTYDEILVILSGADWTEDVL